MPKNKTQKRKSKVSGGFIYRYSKRSSSNKNTKTKTKTKKTGKK